MGIFRRKRMEHVNHLGYYPELPIGRRGRAALRYLLGRPMDNVRWTDATFWRDAHGGEASRWLRLAGWKRAAVRLLGPYCAALGIVVAGVLVFGDRRLALELMAWHVAALAAVLLPVWAWRRVRAYGLRIPWRVTVLENDVKRHAWERRELVTGRLEWERERVLPVARVAASALALPVSRLHPSEENEWVTVPRTYRESGAVEILLPGSFTMTEATRKRFVANIAERLGMKDPAYDFQLEGAAPRLMLRAPVLPPKLVLPEHVLPELEQAAPYTFVLGKSGSEVLTVSLKEDSPHLALSAGSGAGKSEMIKGLIAQALHWGWSVLILDWKGESQEWAEHPTTLPGVRYIREVPALHDAMVSIGEEIEKRRLMRDKAHRDSLPRVLVIGEEWSITSTVLSRYWEEQRGLAEPAERATMPRRSPAVEAGMALVFAGRSLGFCWLMVAIRLSARVTNGNADMRESFGVVLMSRWKGQTVKMLAPDVKPFPKKITTPGRWVAVNGDNAVIYQGVLWSDAEAREWASSGENSAASPWSVSDGRGGTQQMDADVRGSNTLEDLAASDAAGRNMPAIEGEVVVEPVLRSLVDLASSLEYLGFTYNMLRNATRSDGKGDPDFPKVAGGNQFSGYKYDRDAVHAWAKRKRAAEAAEKEARSTR